MNALYKLFNTLVLTAIAVAANAQTLSVQNIETQIGGQTELVISLTGATTMTALQFNLQLPTGLAANTNGATLGAATDGHTLSIQTLASGDLLCIIYSMDLKTFRNGELLRIPVTAESNELNTTGSLYTVRTSTAEAVSYEYSNASFSIAVKAPEPIIAKVVKKEGNTYGYAKLYIPKGVNMKYKVPAKYDVDTDKNGIQLYYGRIDNSNNNIYMYNLPVIDEYYWIDATDVDQAFVLRTNSTIEHATEIEATPVTAEEDAIFTPGDDDHYYFGASLAVLNQLRYNPVEITNQELKDNAEFAGRTVYVMANPNKYDNLTFAKFDKDYVYPAGHEKEGEYRNLFAKSLYIVGKVGTGAPKMEVVFEGDVNSDANTTGIENIQNVDANDGAIYNLQGVRVNNATKGIFIQNGKKYVVK